MDDAFAGHLPECHQGIAGVRAALARLAHGRGHSLKNLTRGLAFHRRAFGAGGQAQESFACLHRLRTDTAGHHAHKIQLFCSLASIAHYSRETGLQGLHGRRCAHNLSECKCARHLCGHVVRGLPQGRHLPRRRLRTATQPLGPGSGLVLRSRRSLSLRPQVSQRTACRRHTLVHPHLSLRQLLRRQPHARQRITRALQLLALAGQRLLGLARGLLEAIKRALRRRHLGAGALGLLRALALRPRQRGHGSCRTLVLAFEYSKLGLAIFELLGHSCRCIATALGRLRHRLELGCKLFDGVAHGSLLRARLRQCSTGLLLGLGGCSQRCLLFFERQRCITRGLLQLVGKCRSFGLCSLEALKLRNGRLLLPQLANLCSQRCQLRPRLVCAVFEFVQLAAQLYDFIIALGAGFQHQPGLQITHTQPP